MEDETPVKKPRKPDKRSRERQAFEGFTQEDVNKYFCMPNMAIDIIAEIDSLAELKVVLYIMRHTWGFHEYKGDKRITVDEFMYGRKSNGKRMDAGTRLSEMSVRNGLDLAEKHGYILSHVDDKDKAKVKKSYELHVKCGVKILDPTRKTGVKILESGVQKLYPAQAQKGKDFRPGSEKDKEERNQRKDSDTPSSSKRVQQKAIAVCKKYGSPEAHKHVGTIIGLFEIADMSQENFLERIEQARKGTEDIEQFFDNLKLLLNR